MRPRLLAVSLAAAALAGAALFASSDRADARQGPKVRPFLGVFTPGQEATPPNTTGGPGVAFATYDEGSRMLRVTYSVSNLGGTPSAAHVHQEQPGVDGPVVFTFTDATQTAPAQEFGPLTKAQANALKKGLLYVNVHTDVAPAGALRAQLLPSPVLYPRPSE